MLCPNCVNYQDTLKVWMGHLATCHPIPTEWLSEKATKLTDDENEHPYTVVTDSRKRRKRPTTPRPLNTFMIFSRHMRRSILSVFPDASNSQLSKDLGNMWRKVSLENKSLYEEEAKRLAQLHAHEFPNYKYQPKKRSHRCGKGTRTRKPRVISRPHSVGGTDEETLKDNNSYQDGQHLSDIENQYIKYSISGKRAVKRECQFNSPHKADLKTENQEIHHPLQTLQPLQPSKPLNVRITNFNESSTIVVRQQRILSNNTMYFLPTENYIITNGIISSQEFENVTVDDEIDITGNIFNNDLDLEWPEIDENYQ